MFLEQVSSIYSIIMNLAGLMICLFQYFKNPSKKWIYSIAFLLGNLLSNYYWGVYVLVMNDYPNVSSLFSYFGWNLAYLVLAFMVIYNRKEKGDRYFNPIPLIVIPINIVQLFMYLQYGGYFNNIWQVALSTFASVMCINEILRYIFRHSKNPDIKFPFVSAAILYYILMEYIAWTGSCFSWPTEWVDPYTYASILGGLTCIILPMAIMKERGGIRKNTFADSGSRLEKLLKYLYLAVVTICCLGGYGLAVWMRNTLTAGIEHTGESDPYSVIAVMLFVLSVVIVSFTVTIILVVSSEQKAVESRLLMVEKNDAERSNAAKSEFLANMSHEIRTPINAVLGMNEMILRESLEARDMLPEAREEIIKIFSDICNYSGNIESAGNNLLSIINDILDFSKIEAGKMEIVNADYKLSSVLNDVSNMISFKAKSKGIEFVVDVDESMPDGLHGDEVRVRQVITNLLNNAVKYTHAGNIKLSVCENRINDKETNLIVKVKDTGIGIKEEDIPKLFTKFERVDMQKNSSVEGTGLGLAITGNLLNMMNGKIEVESEYGVGSEFTVTIPQGIVSEEPIGNFHDKFEMTISALKAPRERFKAPDAKVLIVDDTIMNLTVARGLLKNTFINIDTAISGEEALDITKKVKYDLILMDQRMPNMNGITAMHLIKESGCINADTPFICLTADAVSGAKEKYLSQGFEDYITKPIDSRALLNAMLKFLPKDKIIPLSSEEKSVTEKQVTLDEVTAGSIKESSEVKSDSSKLVNKAVGIQYCNGDEEFYKTLLQEYVNESAAKTKSIEDYYASKDLKNYSVLVHSVKSTSKMIGAIDLSEISLLLEKASDEGDEDTVSKNHAKMLEMYKNAVSEIIKDYDIAVSDNKKDEEEILEFLPS
ncbi:MAG: response regulator [Lachnospiraceae bacterium]|nr:response regulator [Lachnospiraceae bacterium]